MIVPDGMPVMVTIIDRTKELPADLSRLDKVTEQRWLWRDVLPRRNESLTKRPRRWQSPDDWQARTFRRTPQSPVSVQRHVTSYGTYDARLG